MQWSRCAALKVAVAVIYAVIGTVHHTCYTISNQPAALCFGGRLDDGLCSRDGDMKLSRTDSLLL